MSDEIPTVGWREQVERDRDQLGDLVERTRAGGAQECFQFRESLFDRIEVRTVGWEESDRRARPLNRGAHLRLFVDRQVVEDHNIAGPQRWDKDLLDIGEETRLVDRAVENRRCRQPVEPESRDDGVGLPMAARGVIAQPRAPGAAPIAAQQIRRDTAFIQKDVLAHIAERLPPRPPPSFSGDVGPALFVGVYGFF